MKITNHIRDALDKDDFYNCECRDQKENCERHSAIMANLKTLTDRISKCSKKPTNDNGEFLFRKTSLYLSHIARYHVMYLSLKDDCTRPISHLLPPLPIRYPLDRLSFVHLEC
jgi:hypothetical protein